MAEDDLDTYLHITDRTLRDYVIPLRNPKEPLTTPERLAKGDIATDGKRRAQSVPSNLLSYLLQREWLNEEHESAAHTYMAWRASYEQLQGPIPLRFDVLLGGGEVTNRPAERYILLVKDFSRLHLDLVNTACFNPRSPASEQHAGMFHLKYTLAFDKLVIMVDNVKSVVLEV